MQLRKYANQVVCTFTESELSQGLAEMIRQQVWLDTGQNLRAKPGTKELFYQGHLEDVRAVHRRLEKIMRRVNR